MPLWPSHQVGVHVCQAAIGVPPQVYLTVGPVGFHKHPLVIVPVLSCIIGTGTLSHWQDPCSGVFTNGVSTITVGKPGGSL